MQRSESAAAAAVAGDDGGGALETAAHSRRTAAVTRCDIDGGSVDTCGPHGAVASMRHSMESHRTSPSLSPPLSAPQAAATAGSKRDRAALTSSASAATRALIIRAAMDRSCEGVDGASIGLEGDGSTSWSTIDKAATSLHIANTPRQLCSAIRPDFSRRMRSAHSNQLRGETEVIRG